MSDPFKLNRFVKAQKPLLTQVGEELRAGCKCSHWMWFVFPQLAGLGTSPDSRYYAIASLAEARAYLTHPVLGSRLIEWTGLVNALENRSAAQIFHGDDVKFHSSMTLFALADPSERAFSKALNKYFAGKPVELTKKLLGLL